MNTFSLGAAEHACFEALKSGSGFRFSSQVQHAWSARRPVNEGLLTLSILSEEVRLSLLAAWARSGDTLLDFIAQQLPEFSAEWAVCRFEQLTCRALRAAASFRAPDPGCFDPGRVLQRADDAGLALLGQEPALWVAPGLDSLCRVASPGEQRLWTRLLAPARAASLVAEGFPRETIEGLLQIGAVEFTC